LLDTLATASIFCWTLWPLSCLLLDTGDFTVRCILLDAVYAVRRILLDTLATASIFCWDTVATVMFIVGHWRLHCQVYSVGRCLRSEVHFVGHWQLSYIQLDTGRSQVHFRGRCLF